MAFIEVKELSYIAKEKVILQDINLGIERGEFLVLIGPTGAGKTTLIKLLDLLEKPSAGTITYDSAVIGLSERERLIARRRMAFVQQKPLPFNMNVFDNVAAGLRWRGVRMAEIKPKVKAILERVGLGDKLLQNARTLSGGEMQRVAIARSIVSDPEVLFLDEPTANLDPVSSLKIEEVLGQIIRESRTTVVMSTHDMSQGQRLAQRIGVMIEGHLLQIGQPAAIFTNPESQKVAQFVGMDNIWPGTVEELSEGILHIRINERLVEVTGLFQPGEAVNVLIRPEELTLTKSPEISNSANTFKGKVVSLGYQGPLVRVQLDCGFPVLSVITRRSLVELELIPGSEIYASFKSSAAKVIKRW